MWLGCITANAKRTLTLYVLRTGADRGLIAAVQQSRTNTHALSPRL